MTIVCGKCKRQMDAAVSLKQVHTFECQQCHENQVILFNPEPLHENSSCLGFLDLANCVPFDFIPSDFRASCFECSTFIPFRNASTGTLYANVCTKCFNKVSFSFQKVTFLRVQGLSDEMVAKMAVHSDAKPKRKSNKELGIVPGQPLPKLGTCKHYKQSRRWLRFPCCGKAFACDSCHDDNSDHEFTWANRMICGYCSREQAFSNKPCGFCGNILGGSSAAKTYWEGGGGQRDKSKMSNKDRHKFANNSKTVSKKMKSVNKK